MHAAYYLELWALPACFINICTLFFFYHCFSPSNNISLVLNTFHSKILKLFYFLLILFIYLPFLFSWNQLLSNKCRHFFLLFFNRNRMQKNRRACCYKLQFISCLLTYVKLSVLLFQGNTVQCCWERHFSSRENSQMQKGKRSKLKHIIE